MKYFIFKLGIGIVLLTLFFCNTTKAQSAMDLRINEFLVCNDSNFVDDYGEHHPWIEIYNSAYNSVNIGGCYLTNDLKNPTMYKIPKGQNMTKIATQSYLVFWADNLTTRGILHLNFNLKESKIIALFDANGRTLIDSVTIPGTCSSDVTYGRITDGAKQWDFLAKATPAANNKTIEGVTTADLFGKMDPFGLGMMSIAMSVVFAGLALLYLFFKYMGRFFLRDKRKTTTVVGQALQDEVDEIPGEVNAAIATALYLYLSELHDNETTVLTINKVARTYSPWSSKIYGLRKTPR